MKIKRILLSGFLAFAVLVGSVSVPSGVNAQSAQELQVQVAALLAQIATLQSQISGSTSVQGLIPSSFRFTRNLTVGSRGVDVQYLQILLNADADTRVNLVGRAGGPGSETQYFGALTRAAVIKFQNKHRADVLLPIGLINGTGFVGVLTRAKLNALLVAGIPPVTLPPVINPPPVNPPPVQVASTLTVSAGAQPATTLLPQGALRVPLLRLTLTATGNSTVTVTSMTAQLGGVVQVGAIDSMVLLDESGNQIGLSRVVGTNRMVVFTEPILVTPGSPRTISIGVNMAASLSSFQGQTVNVSLVDIRSNAAQTIATLPIIGGTSTINATLPIGTATVQVGTTGTVSATRDIGVTGQNFSSIRITAGSQEDLILRSIRWTQNGSASASDLANITTVIDGVSYSTAVAAGGRTYISNFGTGIRIPSGQTKEVTIRGDIISGVGRTVSFDIDDDGDINLVGATFGFGIAATPVSTATASTATAEFTTGTPFFSGAVVSITGAAVNISRSSTVPAQNVALNVSGQTIGGFDIEVIGEAVTVNTMQFAVAVTRSSGSSASAEDIRSVTLVSADGTVVAGPVDAVGTGTTGTITFSNVFLPTGRQTYILRGTLGSDFREGDIITVSLTPSTSLSGVRGQTSGTTSTAAPSSTVTAHQVTVRSAAVSASVSSTPSAQTVVAGAQNFLAAQFQLSASGSGEDIRFTSLPIRFTHSGSATDVSNCQLFSGSTALTTGSNVVSPSSSHTSGSDIVFTFNNPHVVSQGTVSTLGLRCNVSPSASAGSTFSFGLQTAPVGTGVQSGQSVTASLTASVGQTMTVASAGTFTVTESFASPSYQIVPSGANVPIAAFTVRAGNESIDLDQIGLQLTGTTASSSPADVTSITLHDSTGAQIGTAFFTGANRTATSTLTGNFVVAANSERDITVRATFAQVGPGQAGTEGAFVKIDYDGNNASTTRAVGQASGSTLTSASTADTDTEGARLFRTIPTVNTVALPSTTLVSGDTALMRFSVTADANGSLGIYKFSLNFSTTTGVGIDDVTISSFTDSSFSTPAGSNTLGRVDPTPVDPDGSGNVEVYAKNSSGTNVPFQVPAGTTRYFEVRGTVSGATTGSTISTRLLGDAAYPSLATLMGTASGVDADTNDNFIWSPNFDGFSEITDVDWTNGYGVRNLPSSGLTQVVSR